MVRTHFPNPRPVGLPRPLSPFSLPTKADFNPDPVFPLPSSNNEVLLFSDGSKRGRKVVAAFTHFYPCDPTTRPHLHPPDASATQAGSDSAPHPYLSSSITGPHLICLPWHILVLDAELYAARCALQYAVSLSPPPKVISLAVGNQAIVYTISHPGYSYQAPLLRDICKPLLPYSFQARPSNTQSHRYHGR